MDVTPELQNAVQALLDDTSLPLLSRWQRVADKLVEGGLAWRAKLQASSMLVHNLNRGGLGVSGHGCHLKGESLVKSGFDMKFLHSAVCCLAALSLLFATISGLSARFCCMRHRNQPRAQPTG